jgi:hypothetical protein
VDAKGNWIVVEAKGGRSELGGRWASDEDRWFEQGTPGYFKEIVGRMRLTDDGMEAAQALRRARREGKIRYLLVRAPIARKAPGLASLRDIKVNEFDLGAPETRILARNPGTVLAGVRPTTAGAHRPPGGPVRILYRPSVTGDPSLPAGVGGTNRYGDIVYSTRGSATDQAIALEHERLHSLLSPKLMPLRKFRAALRVGAYEHSQLMKYLEEALAETYAQLRVNGISGLPSAIRFPIANGYVQLDRVLREATMATIAVGGITYGVYVATDSSLQSDR